MHGPAYDARRYNGAGQLLQEVTVYFMSDSYIGLDQQYTLQLVPCSAPAVRDAGRRPAQPAAAMALTQETPLHPVKAHEQAEGSSMGSKGGGGVEERRARRAAMAAERAAERQRLASQQQQELVGQKGWGTGSAVALGAAAEGQELKEVEWDDEPSCA